MSEVIVLEVNHPLPAESFHRKQSKLDVRRTLKFTTKIATETPNKTDFMHEIYGNQIIWS